MNKQILFEPQKTQIIWLTNWLDLLITNRESALTDSRTHIFLETQKMNNDREWTNRHINEKKTFYFFLFARFIGFGSITTDNR